MDIGEIAGSGPKLRGFTSAAPRPEEVWSQHLRNPGAASAEPNFDSSPIGIESKKLLPRLPKLLSLSEATSKESRTRA